MFGELVVCVTMTWQCVCRCCTKKEKGKDFLIFSNDKSSCKKFSPQIIAVALNEMVLSGRNGCDIASIINVDVYQVGCVRRNWIIIRWY